MKELFGENDFIELFGAADRARKKREAAAYIANSKIEALIESSPVVFASKPDGKSELWSNNERKGHDTHRARLAFIEEIKKECPGHEPGGKLSKGSLEHVNRGGSVNDLKTFCKHCGVELVPEWREVK